MAKKQERITANSIEELRNGAKVAIIRKVHRLRDCWIKHYIKMFKEGKLSLRAYWDCIIDVKKDFDIGGRVW